MARMTKTIERIPTWAMCAIINDDKTGLSDEDIRTIEEWFETTGYDYVCCPNGKPYFTYYPSFGLASDVYDCVCVTL